MGIYPDKFKILHRQEIEIMRTLLISLYERHSQNILNGLKTIELRKSKPTKLLESCSLPCNIFLYETKPTSAIIGVANVIGVENFTPFEWCKKHKDLCLTEQEIISYLNGKPGYGLKVNNARRLKTPISLSQMKKWGITPPQGYYYLSSEMALELLKNVV